ncbi:hypothetical protein M8C21_003469 [Ambrosia artemisiifolia]|uniref:Uncharacterized protein n=1 Tax=Ambrosia artemisiifolia TaxID=4212 RepID=A0AAD5CUG6_AMBAR|nr:hypothetical protein M8C21_003469 [Ambrosia artemisiifolia]
MDWYVGPTLMEALDRISPFANSSDPLRLPIKKVTKKASEDMEMTLTTGRVHLGTLERGVKITFQNSVTAECDSVSVSEKKGTGGWTSTVEHIYHN